MIYKKNSSGLRMNLLSVFRLKNIIPGIIIVAVMSSCRQQEQYAPEKYYPSEVIDSIMVDIVTLMGKKPRNAGYTTRHDSTFRMYYTDLSKEFKMSKLFVADDSTHYYYIIRPARHPLGNKRGVGGKFLLDQDYKIREFEEIFVTQVSDEESLNEKGVMLFNELIKEGNIEKYLSNKEIIEWPDDNCRYDKEKNEWRCDVK